MGTILLVVLIAENPIMKKVEIIFKGVNEKEIARDFYLLLQNYYSINPIDDAVRDSSLDYRINAESIDNEYFALNIELIACPVDLKYNNSNYVEVYITSLDPNKNDEDPFAELEVISENRYDINLDSGTKILVTADGLHILWNDFHDEFQDQYIKELKYLYIAEHYHQYELNGNNIELYYLSSPEYLRLKII